MWPDVIVDVYNLAYAFQGDVTIYNILMHKPFVLYDSIDAFGNCILQGITTLGHAY